MRVDGRVERRGDVAVDPRSRVTLGPPAPRPLPWGLRLVHEDGDVIVVDKPAGLLTIAAPRERERTVYRALTAHARATARRGQPARVFVVHRLDRETSGLLVFARTPAVKRTLQAQFAARAVERVYQAVVEGRVREETGRLLTRLGDDAAGGPVRPARSGREAITRFRTLARGGDCTLLELTLETGRRGQIRAQLAQMGHAIVGDAAYGSRRDPLRRVALHATRLAFRDATGGWRRFDSPAPAAFARIASPGRRDGRARAGPAPNDGRPRRV